jgi:hypothetical protein
MPITLNSGRQDILSAVQDINFGDMVSGVAQDAVELPNGAIVIGGALAVETPFNSATSDTLAVTGVWGETLLAATSIAAAGVAALVPSNGKAKTNAAASVKATWTGAGAAPTAGKVRIIVNYVVTSRAHHSHG